jgi:uncharacterized protein (AIM24 family)
MLCNIGKDMTKEQIKIELEKAKKAYANCGCRAYKEKIIELEKKLKNG